VEITRAAVRRERMGHIDLAAPVAHVWYTRRVPSYLGLLLDISRRNLDRVLYFAQYIITYVDEEARQKALKRLDEESERERKRLTSTAKEAVVAIKGKVEGDLEKRKAQRQDRAEKLDEKLNAATEPLMKEAQALEKRIEERMGGQIRTPIVFESAKVTIAEAGETIGREHLTKLRKAVKARLDDLKDKNAEERERALSKIDTDITTLKESLATEIEAVETKLSQDVEALQTLGAQTHRPNAFRRAVHLHLDAAARRRSEFQTEGPT
jgi:DNA-directed RNA polymerase subunit beta'